MFESHGHLSEHARVSIADTLNARLTHGLWFLRASLES